jgi:hypothetical protein
MRKTGSLKKKHSNPCEAWLSASQGRTDIEGDEEKWFRKKPSKKSLVVAEFEVLRRSQGRGSLARDGKVEEPPK